ncbi:MULTISPECIES: TnsA endonuclease N-terminal domain-containing protein [Neptuniibacter]|jgi:hypothetical protein|uniref:TnsA endonuclease N-terminal domain-containing protein n=1 Tax=Neptuniibacter TaxID=459520 RepID=UPI000830D0A7|nr:MULTISPECIES: TnsA endonuclease N-terminal domain-containing protein [Neptuniibacter]MDO6514043.1 TnsA endonuclease N-terminal domain-containing protein [Neptuniibacter sp. 2_MG-2023]|tara:strand:- start:11053 stop:11814 length:762 start_codon:yes stop_codon:yes gene_type:complete
MSKKNFAVPQKVRCGDDFAFNLGPELKHSRSREPVTRSRRTIRGHFPSVKMERMIDWESQLERRACHRFEFSPSIKQYYEQPESIWLFIEGKYRRYTPDFKLHFTDGSVLIIEIKPFDHLQKRDIRDKLILASLEFEKVGRKFGVITDQELPNKELDRNIHFLRQYQKLPFGEAEIEKAKKFCEKTLLPSISGLAQILGRLGTVYALLANNVCGTDMNRPIEPDSLIIFVGDTNHETCIFSYRSAPDFELVDL